eukprot:TRINITY_DN3062_c0_g1_i1.p1 TRINITY_DN3062_c0_g1~~TRINITY_DN3062_c0_g1_i1.p1  ORF type:complete len:665 (-),score=172.10 TRINITY_DN3062_c0_g1_i1:48-2042(-)
MEWWWNVVLVCVAVYVIFVIRMAFFPSGKFNPNAKLASPIAAGDHMPTATTVSHTPPTSLPIISRVTHSALTYLLPAYIKPHPVSPKVRCRDITILTSDGVQLVMTHYFPEESKMNTPGPVILIRTPYERTIVRGTYLATAGFHVLVSECRNDFVEQEKGLQESSFPFQYEGRDGFATLKWIEEQPFFNGSIGMYGVSYMGKAQYAVVDLVRQYNFKSLKALLPVNACSDLFEAVFPQNVLNLELLSRWVYLVVYCRDTRITPLNKGIRMFRTAVRVALSYSHLPVMDFDTVLMGKEVPFVRQILAHPKKEDEFWKQKNMKIDLCSEHANCPPTNLVGGWYDVFLRGVLKDFNKINSAGVPCRLTIGWWTHWDMMAQSRVALEDGFDWFKHFLSEDAKVPSSKQEFLELFGPRVKLFLLGTHKWIGAEEFPPSNSAERIIYFGEDGFLRSDIFGDEKQLSGQDGISFAHYKFDPADPTPSIGGSSFDFHNTGRLDNSPLEKRKDVLVFSSLTLEEDVAIVGLIKADLIVWSSNPLAHFVVRLCDVTPEGKSLIVCDGIGRLEDAEVLHEQEVKHNGSEFKCVLRRLRFDVSATASLFKQGHQIRIHVTSGAHPRWLRNLGTGHDYTDDLQSAKPSDQLLFYQADQGHKSSVSVSVMPTSELSFL